MKCHRILQQGLSLANNLAWTLKGRSDQVKSDSRSAKANPGQGLADIGLPGFGGESSKSSNYLVRAGNEVVKRIVNSFKNEDGDSPPSSSEEDWGDTIATKARQIVEKGGQLINVAKEKGGEIIASGKKRAQPYIEAAQPHIQALPATVDMGSLYLKSQFGAIMVVTKAMQIRAEN